MKSKINPWEIKEKQKTNNFDTGRTQIYLKIL